MALWDVLIESVSGITSRAHPILVFVALITINSGRRIWSGMAKEMRYCYSESSNLHIHWTTRKFMQEKTLVSIFVLRASIHAGFVAFISAYPLVAVGRFFQHFDPLRHDIAPLPIWITWLVVPAAFALFSGLSAAAACLAYNLSARLFGGIRYIERTVDIASRTTQ